MKLNLGKATALVFWALAALVLWWGSRESEFDRQVRVRCEELGGLFERGLDGSLACRRLAKV